MNSGVINGIKQIVDKLRSEQSPDGSWNYPFEIGISTDSYMIILLKSLDIHDENLIKSLTERILSKQEKNGAWKLFYDEGDGNLSATLEAYVALLYSGLLEKTDPRLIAAKRFILTHGGMKKSHTLTKIMLAITGHIKWPSFFPIPIELMLLPPTFPINLYDFSAYGRANLVPIMILAQQKFSLKEHNKWELNDLMSRNLDENERIFTFRNREVYRSLFSEIHNGIKRLLGYPAHLHQQAMQQAKMYMVNRIEPDGTFLTYFSSTFLMIYALLSLGYSKKDPLILKAVDGLKSMQCKINGYTHMQYTTATVWNTSLINSTLQIAGISPTDPTITKSIDYLISRQHMKYGDWIVHNPSAFPGGWGFADRNTIHPDVDDSTTSLKSIAQTVPNDIRLQNPWERGVRWVLSMQNDDGGWPAFEKNTNSALLSLLPIDGGEYLVTDPSSADLTGRTLEFLGNYTNLSTNDFVIRKGVNWLLVHQEQDGSWYGRWGICYIYGTWAAITGLKAVGMLSSHRAMMNGVRWLENIQNEDGGWGESCKSDSQKQYVPLNQSTLTHTAWAVDALIAAHDQPTKSIKRGIQYLLDHLDRYDWTTDYPKGQGMAGAFYIHYHSYRYIFPLLALSHYQNKFLS
ncbi:squalene--hopene cyclase [Niallia sp. Krafla_26]|uniref:squalene--hopene cyclase n=1 Tax=Niallia sp. Krafla_26 TaxID=3064703 RepID=UPI003D176043